LIAIDTNLLVYAHRPECPAHDRAFAAIADLAASNATWCVPVHCLVEFAAVVTNPRIWRTPSSAPQLVAQVEAWLECPRMRVLGEDAEWWPVFCECLQSSRAQGGQVHDARVAACCRYHGVRELWTADRDFGRYPWLTTRNPLVEP
jgi:toxin-antitoxin system PIN domain toxin